MKLSELNTGESGVIVKVSGHGGFRKRIIEMGFIKGKKVDVLLNAPLQDPVKYKIMGYEVSLRHSEADHIEVVSVNEAKKDKQLKNADEEEREQVINSQAVDSENPDEQALGDKMLVAEQEADRLHHVINVALIGNPNCGKTSLFNFASGAHERVGNYSGVTVDAKVGEAEYNGYHFNLVDLPGTYSLSAYSPEELYVRKQLIEHTPDIVINVIDTSNLERNLYLTTQLIDMHIRMVCALNMFDETEKRGDNIDYDKLGELFGIPMVPTVFKNGRGVDQLFDTIIEMYEGREGSNAHYRHIHINHGHEIEHGIEHIQEYLKADDSIRQRYSTRYLSIKLLENDKHAEEYVSHLKSAKEIFAARDEAARRVKEETMEDSETAIMDAKYGFIHGALQEAGYETGMAKDTYQVTHLIDRILTNKYVGFPIFVLLLFIMFSATFVLGEVPKGWIEDGVAWLGTVISTSMPDGPVKDMLVDGVIGGVGAVIVFLPQILILYFFISYMEDSGYMARAAFIMDKLMHKMGLHGKSFIPLIMGFGCNVPAVMATRTIESHRSRLITMLILPLLRVPIRRAMAISAAAAFVITVTVQGGSVADALRIMVVGYHPTEGLLASVVSGGGLVSMLTPFLMIPLAALYTGILEGTGALTQAQSVLERSTERIGRFPTMILLSLLAAMVLCNQTIVVMMEHQLIGAVYAKDGAEHEELAMDIANSGVTIAGLIPWCIACAVPLSMLGVGVEALPYACLLYLIPLYYLFTKRFFFPAKSKGSETPV